MDFELECAHRYTKSKFLRADSKKKNKTKKESEILFLILNRNSELRNLNLIELNPTLTSFLALYRFANKIWCGFIDREFR